MADAINIHVVRKADLRSGAVPDWKDDDRIADLGAHKRAVLLSNPLSESETDPVQLVGVRRGDAIGRLDLLAGRIRVGANECPVLWTSALYVKPDTRNSLLGVSLLTKMQRLSSVCMVCGVSQKALPVFRMLKWVDFELPRWIQIRNTRAIVDRYVGTGPAGRALMVAGNVLARAHGRLLHTIAKLRARSLVVRRCLRAPQVWDSALAQADGGVSCHRSARWLNWQIESAVDGDSRSKYELHVVERPDGTPAGYFATKVRFHETATSRNLRDLLLGSVQDWRVFEPSAVGDLDLILLAVDSLRAHPVDAIEVCADDRRLGRDLGLIGFVPAGSLHVMFRAGKDTPLGDGRYRNRSEWSLRPAEGDNFLF